jgi:hypothetical protein
MDITEGEGREGITEGEKKGEKTRAEQTLITQGTNPALSFHHVITRTTHTVSINPILALSITHTPPLCPYCHHLQTSTHTTTIRASI